MSRRDEGYFSAKDGTRLYWQSAEPEGSAKAVIAIVHGYGDHAARYRHVIDALVGLGFAVHAFDYRGHGKADGQRGVVSAWSDYMGDLELFWSRVLASSPKALKKFVLAHSHGALMATHWVLRAPEGLAGVVFTGPFYRLAFDPPALKLAAAKVFRRLAPSVALPTGLKVEQLSSDAAWQASTAADPLYGRVISSRVFFGQLAAQAELAGSGNRFTLPVLMMGGAEDPVASMPAAKAYFETIASTDKTWRSFEGMRHEVLNEARKEEVIDAIAKWISDRS